MENKTYKNGQLISEQKGSHLTYFYKNGKVKAKGIFENNLMQGEWIFYRETGQLWQMGNFKKTVHAPELRWQMGVYRVFFSRN